jgi:glycosyltransferase involved in cell wall biosynthesis
MSEALMVRSALTSHTVDEGLQIAVADLSCARWNRAVQSWEDLAEAGRYPLLAKLFIADCAARCGDLELASAHLPVIRRHLSEDYASRHESAVETLRARRSGSSHPDALEDLSRQELIALGRAAVNGRMWSYGARVWNHYLSRGFGTAHFEACKRLGSCYAGLGEHHHAITYFEEALDLRHDEKISLQLDRAQRLEQREADGFNKHTERLAGSAVIEELRKGTARLAATDAAAAAEVVAELRELGHALGVDLVGDLAATVEAARGRAASGSETEPTSRAASTAEIHEIQLFPRPRIDDGSIVAPSEAPSAVPPEAPAPSPAEHRPQVPARGFAAIDDLPLTAARGLGGELRGLAPPDLPSDLPSRLAAGAFDTIVFVPGAVRTNATAGRIASEASRSGRRVLIVGVQPNDRSDAYDFVETSGIEGLEDAGVLLLPDMNGALTRALGAQALGAADGAVRLECRLVALASCLGPLIDVLAERRTVILLTHGHTGLFVGGAALRGSPVRHAVRWRHDVAGVPRAGGTTVPSLHAASIAWMKCFAGEVDDLGVAEAETATSLMQSYALSRMPCVRAGEGWAEQWYREVGDAGSVLPAPRVEPVEPEPVADEAGETADAGDLDGHRLLSGRLDADVVESLPLVAAKDIGSVLLDVEFPPAPSEVMALLRDRSFDTVMFVVNGFTNDPRVVKTASAVTGFGRRLLAIGLQANDGPLTYTLKSLDDGTPLILVPNMNRPINIAMRARKLPTAARAPRHELWLACMGLCVGSILEQIPSKPGLVLHSHDYHGMLVGGVALAKCGRRRDFWWIHDAHEFIRQYDIIDPGLQAAGAAWEEMFIRDVDHMCTVSEELAARLQEAYDLPRLPSVIYNTNLLSSRYKYRGESVKAKMGLTGKYLMVHSGTVTKGRGVENAIVALPRFPNAVLLLITESKNATTDKIEKLALQLGVADRVLYHPFLPHDEVVGFIADVDLGLITPDRYGNADVGLANKLFDYILAGVPVVSSDTDAMRRFMTEWPIGEVFEAGNAESLSKAIASVMANPERYKQAINSRIDFILKVTWEEQIARLYRIYDELTSPQPSADE